MSTGYTERVDWPEAHTTNGVDAQVGWPDNAFTSPFTRSAKPDLDLDGVLFRLTIAFGNVTVPIGPVFTATLWVAGNPVLETPLAVIGRANSASGGLILEGETFFPAKPFPLGNYQPLMVEVGGTANSTIAWNFTVIGPNFPGYNGPTSALILVGKEQE